VCGVSWAGSDIEGRLTSDQSGESRETQRKGVLNERDETEYKKKKGEGKKRWFSSKNCNTTEKRGNIGDKAGDIQRARSSSYKNKKNKRRKVTEEPKRFKKR